MVTRISFLLIDLLIIYYCTFYHACTVDEDSNNNIADLLDGIPCLS